MFINAQRKIYMSWFIQSAATFITSPTYCSDRLPSFEVVNMALIQLMAWTCGKSVTPSLPCPFGDSLLKSLRSVMALSNNSPLGLAPRRAVMIAGIPAERRVIAEPLCPIKTRVRCANEPQHQYFSTSEGVIYLIPYYNQTLCINIL